MKRGEIKLARIGLAECGVAYGLSPSVAKCQGPLSVRGGLVYFVVSANRKQEDCFRTFVLDKFEENP